MNWLNGKKTILATLLIAIFNGLEGLGIIHTNLDATATVNVILGLVALFCRLISSTPGPLAPPPNTK